MTQERINEALELHGKWLRNEEDGVRADLSYASLSGADLSGADLSGANLLGANFFYANLSRAYLSGANLLDANLLGANLSYADLSGANLSGVNLSGANLSGADLSGAVQSWAQVAFMGHGQRGRMLTAIRLKAGEDIIYQCGCFQGSRKALVEYIDNGEDQWKASRMAALEAVDTLIKIERA